MNRSKARDRPFPDHLLLGFRRFHPEKRGFDQNGHLGNRGLKKCIMRVNKNRRKAAPPPSIRRAWVDLDGVFLLN